MLDAFLKGLEQPEYVHVLLNPLPVYGLAMGLVAMAVALTLRSREARIVALCIILVAATSVWPVLHYGRKGYDRVKAMSDNEGQKWLDEHRSRGEQPALAFYVVATLALAAIGAEWKRSGAALPLTIVISVLSAGVLVVGIYISYSGGHIRHKEFRFEPAPARPAAAAGLTPSVVRCAVVGSIEIHARTDPRPSNSKTRTEVIFPLISTSPTSRHLKSSPAALRTLRRKNEINNSPL